MRIVYCLASTYNSGGKDRVVCCKANFLVQQGVDVVIITTDQKGREPFFSLDPRVKQIDLGLNYEDTNNLPFVKRYLVKRKLIQKHQVLLARCLESISPDIVISTFEEDAEALTSISRSYTKVMELHYSKERRYNEYKRSRFSPLRLLDWWRTKYDEYIVKKFDCLVSLTEIDRLKWTSACRSVTIPNPLPFDIPPTPASLIEKKVIAVGRLSSEKNFEDLVDIWAEVDKEMPGWCLEIVGEGYMKGRLLSKISDLGLEHTVKISPPVSNIVEKYRGASILAMTSRYEGFGMVLIEAMACGLPVVAYDCPYGPREIISDGIDGALIPMGDKKAYATSLLALMGDYDMRFLQGTKALKNVYKYEITQVMKQWEDLFRDLKINKYDDEC